MSNSMDFFTAMEVSASGLAAQRTRMNVASSNLANAQTTQAAGGGPYKRKDVVLASANVPGAAGTQFSEAVRGVEVAQITQDSAPARIRPRSPAGECAGLRRLPERQPGRGDGRHDHRLARLRGRHHLDDDRGQHGRARPRDRPMSGIAPIPSIAVPGATEAIKPIEQSPKSTDLAQPFASVLSDARKLEDQATDAATRFANGDPGMGIHEVVIAAEKANIAVRYATTLKNKAVEAYRELMNTQV
jgi:flagellar basal-body rod protein FlgC